MRAPCATRFHPEEIMAIQLRTHENGGVCCSSFNRAGERVAPAYPCEKCKAHVAAIGLRETTSKEHNMEEDFTPVDPYAEGLKRLRAATLTPAQEFAERYAAEGLAALAAEYDEVAALRAAHEARQTTPKPRVLSAAELAAYEPPDPYAEGLKVWRGVR
jgi:hypothetical protein